MDHSDGLHRIISLIICGSILTMIFRARRGKQPFIRRIPGLTAIDEAVGRATEMGRPMLLVSGLGEDDLVITLQAIAILSSVARAAAKFGNRIITPVYVPQLMPAVEQAF